MRKQILLFLTATLLSLSASPIKVSPYDKRMGTVTYNPNDVIVVYAKEGYFTMIEFDENEEVIVGDTGFNEGWTIKHSANTKQIVDLKSFQQNVKSRMHYYKWALTDDLSVRFFIHFEKDEDKNYKYFLKSHKNKEYTELTVTQAQEMINQMSSGYHEEIIGRLINGVYEKIISDRTGLRILKE
jgi:hypothetical protein